MTTNWVYIRSEPGLFTVGFYDPSGNWHPHADFESRDDAAREVIRLTHGAADPASLELKLLRKENDELNRRVEELERSSALHDCMDSFAKPVEVHFSPNDDRFSEGAEPFCRIVRHLDRGDPSVGIWPTDVLVLADDQSGTWMADRVPERTPTEAQMVEEFAVWRKGNGFGDFDGDADELYSDLVAKQHVAFDWNRQRSVRWLANFARRWEQASRSWADDRSSLQADRRSV